MRAKSQNLKKRVEVAKRYRRAPCKGKPVEQGPLQDGKVGVGEAQTLEHASRRFLKPMSPRTALFGVPTAGKWRACGWSVVQSDYDEELGPLHGMYSFNGGRT